MNIDDFVAEQIEALTSFRRFWLWNQVKFPESFPRELPDGEWDEQYRCWDGDEKEAHQG